jgi:ATP-dependent RNA helicase RhlE
MSFENLGLKPELLRAVAEKGYTTPSPIQSQAIPAVLSGRDLIAGAQTGTGKTAAFVLPTLQRLTQSAHSGRTPRALVLTPTRELAAQVAESARNYGKYVNIRTAVVFGGVSINPQIDTLRSGCDLLIATPGRLLDLAEQRAVDLREVQVFVLDEADRMLDMGFIHAIRRILKLLPAQRQNLMFSATYSEDIRELASRFLRDPATVEVAARNATADRVEQTVYRVSKEHKRHLLAHLIDSGNWHQVLIFTRTKHGANRLAQQLEGSGIRSSAIHGNKSQGARVRALADFKDNKITALVATEVAARGLDIKELPHVVNYELPNVPEDYVHRIGRTARAGTTGSAVSLVSPDEASLLRDIERVLRRSLSTSPLPEFPITAPPPGAQSSGSERPPRTGSPRRHSDGGGGHDGGRRSGGGGRQGGERRFSGGGDRPGRRAGNGDGRDARVGNRDGQGAQRPAARGSETRDSRRGQGQPNGNRDHGSRASEPNGNVAPRNHDGQRQSYQGGPAPRSQGQDQRAGQPSQRHSHDHRGSGHSADQRGGNRSHGHGRPGGFGNGNSQGQSRPQRQRRTGSY